MKKPVRGVPGGLLRIQRRSAAAWPYVCVCHEGVVVGTSTKGPRVSWVRSFAPARLMQSEAGQYRRQPSVTVAAGNKEFGPPQELDHDRVLHLVKKDPWCH